MRKNTTPPKKDIDGSQLGFERNEAVIGRFSLAEQKTEGDSDAKGKKISPKTSPALGPTPPTPKVSPSPPSLTDDGPPLPPSHAITETELWRHALVYFSQLEEITNIHAQMEDFFVANRLLFSKKDKIAMAHSDIIVFLEILLSYKHNLSLSITPYEQLKRHLYAICSTLLYGNTMGTTSIDANAGAAANLAIVLTKTFRAIRKNDYVALRNACTTHTDPLHQTLVNCDEIVYQAVQMWISRIDQQSQPVFPQHESDVWGYAFEQFEEAKQPTLDERILQVQQILNQGTISTDKLYYGNLPAINKKIYIFLIIMIQPFNREIAQPVDELQQALYKIISRLILQANNPRMAAHIAFQLDTINRTAEFEQADNTLRFQQLRRACTLSTHPLYKALHTAGQIPKLTASLNKIDQGIAQQALQAKAEQEFFRSLERGALSPDRSQASAQFSNLFRTGDFSADRKSATRISLVSTPTPSKIPRSFSMWVPDDEHGGFLPMDMQDVKIQGQAKVWEAITNFAAQKEIKMEGVSGLISSLSQIFESALRLTATTGFEGGTLGAINKLTNDRWEKCSWAQDLIQHLIDCGNPHQVLIQIANFFQAKHNAVAMEITINEHQRAHTPSRLSPSPAKGVIKYGPHYGVMVLDAAQFDLDQSPRPSPSKTKLPAKISVCIHWERLTAALHQQVQRLIDEGGESQDKTALNKAARIAQQVAFLSDAKGDREVCYRILRNACLDPQNALSQTLRDDRRGHGLGQRFEYFAGTAFQQIRSLIAQIDTQAREISGIDYTQPQAVVSPGPLRRLPATVSPGPSPRLAATTSASSSTRSAVVVSPSLRTTPSASLSSTS